MFLLALAAALSPSAATAQSRTPTHVACVGDSITAGLFATSSSAAYPSVLQTRFGSSVQVRNFGHSGATMMSVADLPYRNQAAYTNATSFVSGAGATAVVDVIIMLGTNDSKGYNWMVGTGTRAQQFVADCTAMVDHFASLPTRPAVYLALPARAFANTYGISGTIIHDQMLPLIRQVAAAKGVPVIDVDTPTASRADLFPDGVHPNDTGYALIAQVMYDGLLRAPPGQDGGADAGGSGDAGGVPADAGRGDAGAAADGAADARAADAGDAADARGAADAGGAADARGAADAADGGPTTIDAGAGPSSGSGCACHLLAGDGGKGGGASLLLAAVALSSLWTRDRRRKRAPSR